MIVVKVELHSAITGEVSELARMHIANDGMKSRENPDLGDYKGKTFVKGRPQQVARQGAVKDYPRWQLQVWCLVRRMLDSMSYK